MKQNKVLQFANKQASKTWSQFQIKPIRPSVDPTVPPCYLIDVQGQRADGVVFTTMASIDKAKFDLLPAAKALQVGQQLLQQAITQLMTFTGCPCTVDTECEQHKTNVMVH